MNIVHGTWDLQPRAAEAAAWMFVYPREPRLLSKYIDQFMNDDLETIVWLGPRADWADHEQCFRGTAFSEIHVQEDAGLAEFEMLVVVRRGP